MPIPVRIALNLPGLEARATQAFEATVREYAQWAQDSFADSVWDWAGVTHRRNSELAGSPRNLVDTGELRDSQQPPEFVGLNARITWDADYAAAVFLGAVYRKRRYSLPARNLPLHVLQQMNVPEVFMRHFDP